jgi:hypothetical protein
MKKTEYFIHQVSYNQYKQGLDKVKEIRDNFISSTSIEKIVEEDIIITPVHNGNQTNFIIKLTYY